MIEVMQKVAAGDVDDIRGGVDLKEETGSFLEVLLLCYAWGLLASLTPCVYPMIPTTLALFANEGGAVAAEPGGDAQAKVAAAAEAAAAGEAGAIGVCGEAADRTDAGMGLGSAGGEDGKAPASRFPIIAKALLYTLGISGTYTTLGIVVTVAL
jgi:cytochrome c biogenesis protein CcdA